MSVRMRHTRAHTNNRRAHHALDAVVVVKDGKSGALRLPHRLDESTGQYRGKQIAEPKAAAKKEPRARVTHHEHVHSTAKDEAKPAEAREAEHSSKAASRPRSRSGMGGGA